MARSTLVTAVAVLAALCAGCSATPHPGLSTDAGPEDARDAFLPFDGPREDAPGADAMDDGDLADAFSEDAASDDATIDDAGPADAFVLDAGVSGCAACHGTAASAAPPLDTLGRSATSFAGVGAHATHLQSTSDFHPVACEECHVVPALGDTVHADGTPAELTWGPLAETDGPASYSGGTCAVYCHGRSLDGGRITTPTWTSVDGRARACGACHGFPPPAPHPVLATRDCSGCHPYAGVVPLDPTTHVNGTLDVSVGCDACHGAPPDTGAHRRHFGPSTPTLVTAYGDTRNVDELAPGGSAAYMFGCGNCHPTDPANHRNGTVDVVLFEPGASPASLKARNTSTAAYAGGTCSGVYCHSSGQQAPVYVASPPWTGTFTGRRCAACHGNPPAYPSGGAGTATANGHLVLADDGWEFGHFGGLPGPWHGGEHGTRAAPITCQTCHYETVDPASVGPGGLYYLDTSGLYDLGGPLGYRCESCHTGAAGAPVAGPGAVLTARHVDGQRDVVFDPRTSIPASVTGLPLGSARPAFPYWVIASPSSLPPNSAQNDTTWSLHLAGARYDAASRTCSSVPCHLAQSFGTGAPAYDPLRWGVAPVGYATCSACHQY